MSDLIHEDPTCFAALDAAGLPSAFLDAVTASVPPSSKALGCIPKSLYAMCLNISSLQAVHDQNALGCFVNILTSKVYIRALANDMPRSLASGLDELFRLAPLLRLLGIDMCIEILKTIAAIGGAPVEVAVSVDPLVPMSSATGDNIPRASPILQPLDPGADSNLGSFLTYYINNISLLLRILLENEDTSNIFIRKKGIEAIVPLFVLPRLPLSFGGSSSAHELSIILSEFSLKQSISVTTVMYGALKDHLQATLGHLKLVSGRKFSDLNIPKWINIFLSLSIVHCYLSILTFSLSSRRGLDSMTNLSQKSLNTLKMVGSVNRYILRQLACIDDGKEAEGGSSTPAPVPHVGDGYRRRSRLAGQANATECVAGLSKSPPTTEVAKQKFPESTSYAVLTRMKAAIRGFYLALGKAMISRIISTSANVSSDLTSAALLAAMILAINIHENFSKWETSQGQPSLSYRYLENVVEDMLVVVFDSNKKTCNLVLLNKLYCIGGIKDLLRTFDETSQVLWTLPQSSRVSPMETENGKSKAEKSEEKVVAKTSPLLDTLLKYTLLMELLVTSLVLLTHAPMAEILILPEPEAQTSNTLAKDPETFVRNLQAQVLEVVLPVWHHPKFAQCSANFIVQIDLIITNADPGVGDAMTSLAGGAAVDREVPPVGDLLLTCMSLLQNTEEAVVCPLRDLMVTMCHRYKGQDHTQLISCLLQQVKSCKVDGSMTDKGSLSTISHSLALILSEDCTAQEIAAKNGAVSIALDVLERFTPVKTSLMNEIPPWISALLLVLDHMMAFKVEITFDQPSGSAAAAAASNSIGVSSPTAVNPFISVLGKPCGYMSEDEQRRTMSVVVGFFQMELPSETVLVVLQLCARLIESHPIALFFFDLGGLAAF